MAVGNVAASIASQQEYLRKDLETLYPMYSRLWRKIETKTNMEKAVSNRPSRVPFDVIPGGKFRVMNPDGGDMGLGSGLQQTFGTLSCVYFLQATEYTKLAEISTNSDEKAIANYVTLNQQRAAKTFAGYMDAVIQGDGSNTLDSVVSTTTNGLVVNNANAFQGNQDIDIWSALSGTNRGTVTVQTVDIANNTIWLTSALPSGTTAGDLLLVSGSSGVAASGLYGLQYYQVAGNAGSYMNVPRSTYPGLYSTPNINFNSGALTPALVRALIAQVELAMGTEAADESDLMWHMNVDMRSAWENNALLVQRVIRNEVKGDGAVDMLSKRAPTEMAGREVLLNERAKPGRIDGLALKHWFRLESQPFDYYDVAGQTLFPLYGASGGLQSSLIFYVYQGVQVGNGQPRMGCYGNNIAIPSKYFGH